MIKASFNYVCISFSNIYKKSHISHWFYARIWQHSLILSQHTIVSSKPPPSASPWIAATEGFLPPENTRRNASIWENLTCTFIICTCMHLITWNWHVSSLVINNVCSFSSCAHVSIDLHCCREESKKLYLES